MPDDAATMDHITSRPNLEWGETTKIVLACHQCNHERNEKDRQENAIEHHVHAKGMQCKKLIEKYISLTGRVVDLPDLLARAEDAARENFLRELGDLP